MVLREVHDEGYAVPAGGVLTLKLKAFDATEAQKVEPWFDDPATQRWLGSRDWIRDIFRLQREPVGTEYRGARRVAYHAYTGYLKRTPAEASKPVGFVDATVVDRYVKYGGEEDGKPIYLAIEPFVCASVTVVVAPDHRRNGYASSLVEALMGRPELDVVRIFEAGVEPDNVPSVRTLERAGFVSDYEQDFEGMIVFTHRR